MTKIKFFKKNSHYIGVECSGHTGYAEYGKDILCASLSSLIEGGILGISKVLGIKGKLIRRDNEGYIKFELPTKLTQEKLHDSDILFATMYESVNDLIKGYSKYISMEVIDDVY